MKGVSFGSSLTVVPFTRSFQSGATGGSLVVSSSMLAGGAAVSKSTGTVARLGTATVAGIVDLGVSISLAEFTAGAGFRASEVTE